MTLYCYISPGTSTLCGGSTPVPGHRYECHCFLHSGIRFEKYTSMCFSVSSCSFLNNTKQRQKRQKHVWVKTLVTERSVTLNWTLVPWLDLPARCIQHGFILLLFTVTITLSISFPLLTLTAVFMAGACALCNLLWSLGRGLEPATQTSHWCADKKKTVRNKSL